MSYNNKFINFARKVYNICILYRKRRSTSVVSACVSAARIRVYLLLATSAGAEGHIFFCFVISKVHRYTLVMCGSTSFALIQQVCVSRDTKHIYLLVNVLESEQCKYNDAGAADKVRWAEQIQCDSTLKTFLIAPPGDSGSLRWSTDAGTPADSSERGKVSLRLAF